MSITDPISVMLPPLAEDEAEALLVLADSYKAKRSLLRSWNLRQEHPVDGALHSAATIALGKIEETLKETDAGRLLLTLLSDEARANDKALLINRAVMNWLEG